MSAGTNAMENLEYTPVEDDYPPAFGDRFIEFINLRTGATLPLIDLVHDYDEWAAANAAPMITDKGRYLDAIGVLELAGAVELNWETRTVHIVSPHSA